MTPTIGCCVFTTAAPQHIMLLCTRRVNDPFWMFGAGSSRRTKYAKLPRRTKVCQTASQDQKYAKLPRRTKSMPNRLAGPKVCQTASQDQKYAKRSRRTWSMPNCLARPSRYSAFWKKYFDNQMPMKKMFKMLEKGDVESPEADNLTTTRSWRGRLSTKGWRRSWNFTRNFRRLPYQSGFTVFNLAMSNRISTYLLHEMMRPEDATTNGLNSSW